MTLMLQYPSPGTITSGFGTRTPGKVGSTNHKGIDFSWNKGWTAHAAAAGTVTFVGSYGGWGNLIRVSHGRGYETWYAHLSAFKVRKGDTVRAGQDLGVIGNTGTSAGAHLHFELRLWGVPIDPTKKFGGFAGGIIKLITEKKGDTTMRVIFNKDAPTSEDATRRALIGELTFQVITGPESVRERKLWGKPENVTKGEWAATKKLVEARRKELGLPALGTQPTSPPTSPTAFNFTGTATPA